MENPFRVPLPDSAGHHPPLQAIFRIHSYRVLCCHDVVANPVKVRGWLLLKYYNCQHPSRHPIGIQHCGAPTELMYPSFSSSHLHCS